MKLVAYILSIAFFRMLAILPRFVILFFSDILFLILYYLIGYRKKVAVKNITRSFPDYSQKAIRDICRKFYKHLADVMVESAASQYFSMKRLKKMYNVVNPELIEKYYNKGRSIILVTAHYNNWEWAVPLSYTVPHTILAVYKPLKNKYFDRSMKKIRGRYGARTVPMKQIGRVLFDASNTGELTLTGMVADQRPIKQHIQYWTELLGQKTPVFLGSEKLAKKFNSVVLYMKTTKIRRLSYAAEFELITDQPGETSQYEITEKQFAILEKMVRQEPAYWLWTHDRWKHKYPG